MVTDDELVQILTSGDYLEKEKLKVAQAYSNDKKINLYEAILEKDYLTDENLGKLLADHHNMIFASLKNESIPDDILKIIPEHMAKKMMIIAIQDLGGSIKVGVNGPLNEDIKINLEKKIGKKVESVFLTERDIKQGFSLYKKKLQLLFEELMKKSQNQTGIKTPSEVPITELVDSLIEYAYDNHASDIHIEPQHDESLIRFRIDGILYDVLKVPKSLNEQIITRIKVKSRLRTDEHFSAQDGKMEKELDNDTIDIRVSIVPVVQGEDCVMRLLSSHNRSFNLEDLGMNSHDMERIKKGFSKPFGMILSTGPTGSGKTTTMYAILKLLNIRERNIATIEDPVEYGIEGISQIQVNPKTNLTFAEGLRSILRQDPNVIFVGEIRDRETAGIAVNSAMTGHLVLSTLHTNDASTTLLRLFDMDIEPFLVASSVHTIVAQRLVRKICEKCKLSNIEERTKLRLAIPSEIEKHLFEKKKEIRLYRGKGCNACHQTGYSGRIGLFEVLEVSEKIKQLIIQKENSDVIEKQAVQEGMTTMLEDGLKKAREGLTTVEEVLRVIRN